MIFHSEVLIQPPLQKMHRYRTIH